MFKSILSALLLLIAVFFTTDAQPVKLHPDNPHYFLYNDQPRIFITSAEHYGAVLNLDFDYKKYLKTLHQEGMDYTRIFMGSYVENNESFGIEKNTLAPLHEKLIAPWARSKMPAYINGGNKFDLDRWDKRYFKRLRDFISLAAQLDIIVEITFFSSIYKESYWKFSPLYRDNNINETDSIDRLFVHTMKNGNIFQYQEALVRKIVKEINLFDNVIYEIQNEPWSDQEGHEFLLNNTVMPQEKQKWYTKSNQASVLSLDWQSAIASIVKDEELKLPKHHLLAQNYCNYGQSIPAVDKNVDIMNFHYAWPQAVEWNYGYNRPISFDESGFSPKIESIYRKQAWRFILAGGAVFNNLDYSFVAGYEDGSFEQNSSPGLGTKLLRKQLRFLKDFITQFDFIHMSPSKHLVKHAPGFTYQGLAEIGKSYIFYFEGSGSCQIQLLLQNEIYNVEWWSAETGQILQSETKKASNNLLILKGPPILDDVVLKISH